MNILGKYRCQSWRAAEFYKPFDEERVTPSEWNECPVCGEKPRIWIYDNGEYAKCKCQDTYDKSAASGKTIWEYHHEHNGDMTEWNHNDLRDNWNKYVEQTLKENQ